MRVLPDSSVWIDYVRSKEDRTTRHLEGLIRDGAVLVCGPVLAELLAGAREQDRDDVWFSLGHLAWADLDHQAWREIGVAGAALRRRGDWVPQTDVAIAVAALRSRASVWTNDGDFSRIRSVLAGLELYEPRLS